VPRRPHTPPGCRRDTSREAEHPLSHRQPRRAVAESGNHSGQLLPGNTGVRYGPRRSVQVEATSASISRWNPTHELNDDAFLAACGSGRSTSVIPAVPGSLVRHHDAFMIIFSLDHLSLWLEMFAALESRFDISCQGPWVASESEGGTALYSSTAVDLARSEGRQGRQVSSAACFCWRLRRLMITGEVPTGIAVHSIGHRAGASLAETVSGAPARAGRQDPRWRYPVASDGFHYRGTE